MDVQPLRELGLSDNEIKIYTVMLKIDSSTASTISEKAGMYRPYVYDTLERLQEKGLVNFVYKNNKKFFSAAHPDTLLELIKAKQENLLTILPDLVSFTKLPKEETKVELYKGKEVIKVFFREALKSLQIYKEVCIIGADEKKYQERAPIEFERYFNECKKNGFRERVIAQEGSKFLPAPKETTEYRFIPKEYFSPNAINILQDKVMLIMWGTPDHLIIIRSKEMAEAYRKQFEMLWRDTKKKK